MMPTTFVLPDYPVHVYAEPERRKRISPGGQVFVTKDGETKELKAPLVIDQVVQVTGTGNVTVTETEDKPPRKKRPSEKKAPAKKGKKK